MTAQALTRFAPEAQVISSSWGPTDSGKLMLPMNTHVDRALRYADTKVGKGMQIYKKIKRTQHMFDTESSSDLRAWQRKIDILKVLDMLIARSTVSQV
ncbi:unnamed protein product [Dibothriocephalus latus]|uniref:Uncharacterized protein n=1 Tax=Dibothriocephalus latus TaxID=60516 RepID=A0A3P7Q6W4_DIBLA|nr:unnamed protein product [Dibothriocephalus latus]